MPTMFGSFQVRILALSNLCRWIKVETHSNLREFFSNKMMESSKGLGKVAGCQLWPHYVIFCWTKAKTLWVWRLDRKSQRQYDVNESAAKSKSKCKCFKHRKLKSNAIKSVFHFWLEMAQRQRNYISLWLKHIWNFAFVGFCMEMRMCMITLKHSFSMDS